MWKKMFNLPIGMYPADAHSVASVAVCSVFLDGAGAAQVESHPLLRSQVS